MLSLCVSISTGPLETEDTKIRKICIAAMVVDDVNIRQGSRKTADGVG